MCSLDSSVIMNADIQSDIKSAERGKRGFNCDKQREKSSDSPQLHAKGFVGRRKWGYQKNMKVQLICNVKIDRIMVGSIVRNMQSRNRVTRSGTELLWSRRELTTKVENNLGLSSCAVPQSVVAYVVVYFRRTELLPGVQERSGI